MNILKDASTPLEIVYVVVRISAIVLYKFHWSHKRHDHFMDSCTCYRIIFSAGYAFGRAIIREKDTEFGNEYESRG